MRTSDLLNTIACLTGSFLASSRQAAFPCLSSTADSSLSNSSTPTEVPSQVLAGSSYYEAKQRLVHDEQVVLRTTHFAITVEQPHRYLLNFCRGLRCSAGLTHLAVCLLNDAVVLSTLDMQLSAASLAASCLGLAALLLPGAGHDLPASWHLLLGFQAAEVDDGAQRLLAVLRDSL